MIHVWFTTILFLWVIAVHLFTMPPLVIVQVSFSLGWFFAYRLLNR